MDIVVSTILIMAVKYICCLWVVTYGVAEGKECGLVSHAQRKNMVVWPYWLVHMPHAAETCHC